MNIESTRAAGDAREPIGLIGFEYWCNVVRDYLAGSAYEGHYVSAALDAAQGAIAKLRLLREPPWREMKILHSVNAMAGLRSLAVFRGRGCRIILHWIGADYRRLLAWNAMSRGMARGLLRAIGAVHLIDSPELATDLSRIGIHGEVVRLIPRAVDAEIMPLPAGPAGLAYWADGQADFYGRPLVYSLARRWPEIPFRIVGPTTRDENAPPNVDFLGFRKDLGPVYAETSVLIRVLPHDSISAMVLEALARGRDVIYSREFPGTRQATDEAGAIEAMRQHLAEFRVNSAGAGFVREEFSPRRWAAALREAYDRVLERKAG